MPYARIPAVSSTLGLALLATCLAGCQPVAPLEDAGLTIPATGSWTPVESTRWQVPGQALGAWAGPEGSSFIVYRGLPDPKGSAARLAEGLANRLMNLPGLRILERRELTVAGAPAVRLDAVGPGFGDALAPSGIGSPIALDGKALIGTRLCTVIIQRNPGPLFLAWHAPESAWPQVAPQVESLLGGVTLAADKRSSSSSY